MMQKEKSSGRRRLRLLSLALAVDVALALVNIPAVASGLRSLETASFKFIEIPKHTSGHDLDITEAKHMKDANEDKDAAEHPTEFTVNAQKAVRADKNMYEVSKNETSSSDAETEAEFPGGTEKLMRYLSMNIRYPEAAHLEDRTGKSVVGFSVLADGSISDVTIVESSWPDLDEEAMRVVKAMPKWTPASIDGKPVASQSSIPITFRLQNMEEAKPANHNDGGPYIKLAGGAKLVVGQYDNDTDANAIQAVRVDGKLLTEGMSIDFNDIETYKAFPPSEEFPGGLLDIKLKKK